MSAIAQPSATGITAQAANARTTRDQRREHEHALVGARRDDRLLEDELEEVGEGLQHAPRADDVRPAPDLDRAPDLALGVDQHRGGQQHEDQQQQAFEHVAHEAPIDVSCIQRRRPRVAAGEEPR